MSYSQYGLTAVDAQSSDHDKGIVAGPDGKFYQIDGFKRNQEEGLDEDAGAAFDGKLQADSKAAGWDPSSFNTATDVENALRHLGGSGEAEPEGPAWDDAKNGKPLSDEMAEAKERAQAWTDSGLGGNVYGTGQKAKPGEVDYSQIKAYKATTKKPKSQSVK